MKNGLGNLAARNVDRLAKIVKNRLKRIPYRPALINRFLAQTGLTLEPNRLVSWVANSPVAGSEGVEDPADRHLDRRSSDGGSYASTWRAADRVRPGRLKVVRRVTLMKGPLDARK